jgi:exodeoxyribonuclease-1
MAQTFLWHDYETFGAQPRRDRPAQFAAIRTDTQLNEVGKPITLYCQPPLDTLPDPGSSLITGLTPQECLAKGVPEHIFAAQIEQALGTPDTTGVGFNSMRFDDEVTRFLFWRNLIDPYSHTWQNGCSRWDLIDVMRCAYALRPEGIEWPTDDESGLVSFKLEKLAAANGLSHERAHDALSDVRATLALARLVRKVQPKMFNFCLQMRDKQHVIRELGGLENSKLLGARPFLYVSGLFGAARGCIGVMAPLTQHPFNKNELIAWDLSADPSELADLKPDQVRERMFSANADLPQGVSRLPIKTVHLNQSPIVISSIKTLNAKQAQRWQIDLSVAERNLQRLSKLPDLSALWTDVFLRSHSDEDVDVDEDLYGGFLSNEDRKRLAYVRGLEPAELALSQIGFDDPRLPELVFRYCARNFPQVLSEAQLKRWQAHLRSRLIDGKNGARTLSGYFDRIDQLAEIAQDEHSESVLAALYDWAGSMELE